MGFGARIASRARQTSRLENARRNCRAGPASEPCRARIDPAIKRDRTKVWRRPIATISTRLSNGAGIPNAVIFPSVTLSPEMIKQNIETQTRHLIRRSIVDDL
ncbi:hypothetical protein [Methylobacterium sp. Leaf117]|uniref:hypothetical protein n=1 Tax=Methylobacterium sp. Leaf117 TaxID=1736260 RepID=UPI000B2FF374|nr:hypothetical protein [Methylobacterium sp. Leaf117]